MFLSATTLPLITRFGVLGLLLGLLLACGPTRKEQPTEASSQPNAPIPYDLDNPNQRYILPKSLREVSGLSYYKPGRLALIQDELAVVFIYDLNAQRVVDEHVFGRKGDYEGVEFVNGELYMLRSDGELYHFEPTDGVKILGGGGALVTHIKINLPGKNNLEGLGYDPKLNALLLATKDPAKNTANKPIYFFDLKRATLWQGPVLTQTALADLAGSKPTEEVKPSGIAVDPITGNYYLLASQGCRLVVMTRNGAVLSSVGLNSQLLVQPEGICFTPDGTLYIASEGEGKRGMLFRFALKTD